MAETIAPTSTDLISVYIRFKSVCHFRICPTELDKFRKGVQIHTSANAALAEHEGVEPIPRQRRFPISIIGRPVVERDVASLIIKKPIHELFVHLTQIVKRINEGNHSRAFRHLDPLVQRSTPDDLLTG